MRADLHLHSIYSDGALTPEALVERVQAAGVSLCALTDHDGMEGVSLAKEEANRRGVSVVSGWEISSYTDCKVHVLGYRCQGGKPYREFLEKRFTGAYVRAEEMIARANAYLGLNVTLAEVEQFYKRRQAPMHTTCVVKAYAERLNQGLGDTYRALFDVGMPAYSTACRPTPQDAIEVVHADGGIAVLAHPGRIYLEEGEKKSFFDTLVRQGLDGIECHYTTHTVIQTEEYASYARERGLLVTGGSDFHADAKGKKGERVRVIGQPPFEADEKLLRALFA